MTSKINYILIFTVLIILIGCSESKKDKESSTDKESNEVVINHKIDKGLELLELNCYACHSPNADMTNRLAPPMIAIKKHYISEGTTKAEFTNDIIKFLKNPIEENTKMFNAVKKFGVMPKMEFSDEDLIAMAHYLFDNEIEQPEWFDQHFKEEHGKVRNAKNQDTVLNFREKGLQYALNTKKVLGKNLINSISEKGTEGALAFCNENAIYLTDSMSTQQDVRIKRVSDQPRNPNNRANHSELEYIKGSKKMLVGGEVIKPQIQELEGKMVGYYPILTNKMCMQCHGEPNEQIKLATLEKIMELYPKDQATGYGENELRGIWVVEMEKK